MSKKLTRLLLAFIIIIIVFTLGLTGWVQVNKNGESSLPLNNYDLYNFEGTDLKSYDDNLYTSVLGLDLCDYDEVTSFQKLKDQGIEFLYLRVGYRGYGSKGAIYKDEKFETYYKQAKEYGFKIGVYFFSQAINNEELIEEVNFIFENIEDKDIDLPIAYDFEYISEAEARSDNVDSKTLTSNMELFCSLVEEKGYDSIIYTNLDMITNESFDLQKLFSHDVWFAQYYTRPECKYPFSIWQYSGSANIEGLVEGVDANIMLIPKENI